MKKLRITCALFFAIVAIPSADDKPYQQGQPKDLLERPQDHEKLPGSISIRQLKPHQYEYTISGIYGDHSKLDVSRGDYLRAFEAMIPSCTKFNLNMKQNTAIFSTSRILKFQELVDTIDGLAGLADLIPYWAELEARDLPTREGRQGINYRLEQFNGVVPAELAWFSLPQDGKFETPLGVGPGAYGRLNMVRATAHCMAESRITLRVIDRDGVVIWKHNSETYGSLRVALGGDIEPGLHKIWVWRRACSDSGDNFFLIRGAVAEADTE